MAETKTIRVTVVFEFTEDYDKSDLPEDWCEADSITESLTSDTVIWGQDYNASACWVDEVEIIHSEEVAS